MAIGPVKTVTPIRFGGEFELDTRTYALKRNGRALKLERIPMEVLLLLIERAGQLVTREEIAQRVWGKGVHLDTDNSINSAIRKIRLVLRDDPDEPRFVQTLVGRGYVFLSSSLEIDPDLTAGQEESKQLTADALQGRRIGDYRILHLLGGGGMGVVYKAEDLRLGRPVAIKFLPRELSDDREASGHLEREAKLTSSLDHPNICPVYQFGEHDGQSFIVMPLLEGQTLREWIALESSRTASTCVREAVRLGIQISDALHFAHQAGVVHRDIKPANIFLTSRGEIKVFDFGVATSRTHAARGPKPVTTENEESSAAGDYKSPGTPAYLSPEQLKGETADVRSDLFSFGSLLYEMVAGQRPFGGESAAAIEEAILKEEPRPIRELKPGVPARLEAIVAKALEKERGRRYQSAAEISSDLRALETELEPPSAAKRPEPESHGVRKYHVVTAVVLAAVVLLGVAALLRHLSEPQPFRDFKIAQITDTGRAEAAAISPDGKYVALVNNDNGLKSMRLLNISTGSATEILPPAATRFRALTFSPDGNYLYFRQLMNGLGSEWDIFRIPVLGGKPEQIARDVDSNIIFSPDGQRISYVRANDPEEGKYRIVNANPDGSNETVISIQKIKGFGHDGYPPFASWSPDGKQVVYTFAKMADEPGIMRVLDVQSRNLSDFQHFQQLLTYDVLWLPNGRWMILANEPKTGEIAPTQISAFSLRGRKLYPITRDTNSYSSVSLSSDGRTAAAVQTKTTSSLDLMSVASTGEEASQSNLENVDSFEWDQDGNILLSDGSKLWNVDLKDGHRTDLAADTSGNIVGVAKCSSGYILVNWEYHAGTQGSSIWRLNADGSNPVRLTNGKYDMAPACSPDGQWAYYLDSMQALKRIPIAGGTAETIPIPVPHLNRIMGTISFSADGKTLVALLDITNTADRAMPLLGIVDLANGHPSVSRLVNPDQRIIAGSLHSGGVRFSPDGKSFVYAIKMNGVGDLWSQPIDGSPGHAITNNKSDLFAQFRFSPDGKTLAVKRTHTTSDVVVLHDTSSH